MKVVNKTDYDTRYLRSLFLECEKHIFETYLIHGECKDRYIVVKYKKGRNVAGYAWYHSNSIVMKLPRPTSTRYGHRYKNTINARSIARVYLHEVGHNIGKAHNQMGSIMNINTSWCPDELVPQKQIKAVNKIKSNIIEARADKAQKKLDDWTKKFNRAKTYVKKYQQKVRYYEMRMAANKTKQ